MACEPQAGEKCKLGFNIMRCDKTLTIGIAADYVQGDPHAVHQTGHKYVCAVSEAMDAVPLLLPALGMHAPIDGWLKLLDGILLPGAYSNVEPHHYEGDASESGTLRDPMRDGTTLTLIKRAIECDVPVLGICRGFQEINVALGGSLHQRVAELPDKQQHSEDKAATLDEQYGPVHPVHLTKGGLLAECLNAETTMVNSLHEQGIDRLADPLKVEAVASDGLIEAFSLDDNTRFVLAVQWHPEWKVTQTPSYQALFTRFKQACTKRKKT